MALKTNIIFFIVGMISSAIIMWRYYKPEMDTDSCSNYLNEQGYTVHLRKTKGGRDY